MSARDALLLPVLALIGALLLTGIDLATREQASQNALRVENRVLLDTLTLPQGTRTQLERDGFTADTTQLGLRAPTQIFLARVDGHTAAVIVPVIARDGYHGDIELFVGVGTDGRVDGVRVVRQQETAGLGDAIENGKSDWLRQFVGKSLEDSSTGQWQFKSEGGYFDQITGATITSRAVMNAVQQALRYVADHRAELLKAPTAEGDQP